ncbi:DUF3466 family protein [Tolumonas lignilytica]|jgi:Protein of unknown function (DUF3466).|uniref:DUF3466 family protein n=1 Tax=Tolumonas lignilytica TaxID=1283284 RepID=UPI0004637848|nr:DUF3466 family protein [Tolumonas lignilytica]
MKMTRIAAMLPLLLAGAALADQAPFYSITEVATAANRGNANFGPWALSISGDGNNVATIAVTSNWYSYFHMAPTGMDLAHRYNYENGCTNLLSSATCDAYLNKTNTATQWFADLSNNADQTYSITASGVASGSVTTDTNAESVGVVTRYSRDSTATQSVGYVSLTSHQRKAVATLSGSSVDVTSGTDYAFASAYDITPVGSNYLVLGTAGAKKDSAFSYCYSNSSLSSNSAYCPGYETQAGFWLLNSSGVVTSTQLAASYNTSYSTSYPYTASAMKVADVNGQYVAVGYSATEGYSAKPKNLATFWNLGTGSLSATPATSLIFSNSGDNPGTNDKDNPIDHSWAVDINTNGYIVGNRVYRKLVSRNYPTQMFIAKYASGAITSTSIPVSTDGVDSEAAALNNNDQVVGWTDERSETTQPVYGSVPRLQEAFLYNITSGNRYAINDLICGLNSASAKTCVQNGKYYYIEYANDILDDGTILASARRFDNYSDWSNLTNGTNVVVKLSKNYAFSSGDVPSSYVVTNQLPVFDYGASSGGGSFGIWGLLMMAGAAVVGQYRRFVKKS